MAIEFVGISKRFGGVQALSGVTLTLERGECHALLGENGAGKSTLGKILAGIHRPDEGTLSLDGRPVHFASPRDARRAGVGMVHQELAFCPDLSVAENLCLGRYPRRAGWLLNRGAMRRTAAEMLRQVGLQIDVDRRMATLSVAQEQLVQIAAAIATGAGILVFDEPTSSLSETETRRLLARVHALRSAGRTILYVSHRMPEVLELADRISVLRDGRLVGTRTRAEAREPALVEMMIGRPLAQYFPRHTERPIGDERLRVENLDSPGRFSGVSFRIHAGEIVGLAGLVGAGRSEIARAIFGLDPRATGRVMVDGKPLRLRSVAAALRAGIGLAPEDRKREGLVLPLSGRFNFSLAILERFRRLFWISRRTEKHETRTWFGQLAVRTESIEAPVSSLSGGNEQKVVLARWLARRPGILIVDEPTRGVDVGAKAAIHNLLDDLAAQGMAILLISSDLPELIALSTRILVVAGGRLAGELSREQAAPERVLSLMTGQPQATPA